MGDQGAEVLVVVLDGCVGRTAMREDVVDPELRQRIDCSELLGLIERIERHVERDTEFAAAHLAHTLSDLDEAAGGIEVEFEALALGAALEATEDDTVDAVGTRVADVGLHRPHLRLGIIEVAATGTDDHTELGPLVLTHDAHGLLDHAGGRCGTALGEVVAQLDAIGTGAQGRLDIGEVLGAIFEQHKVSPK